MGTLAWLVVPAILIGATGRYPLLGVLGRCPPGGDRALPTFLASALCGRRENFGAFLETGDPRSIPACTVGVCLLAHVVLLLAAIPLYLLKIEMIPREPPGCRAWFSSSSWPGPPVDRLGIRALRPPRPASPLDLSCPGPHRHRRVRIALRPGRVPRPVHVVGRRQQPLRTARVFAPCPLSQHVSCVRPPMPAARGRSGRTSGATDRLRQALSV